MCGLGLKEQFAKNAGFAKWMKMVMALPLLPTSRITGMWADLKREAIPNMHGIPRIPAKALNRFKKYMWKLGESIFAAFMDVEKEMGRLDNNLTITRPRARKNVLNARRLQKAEEKLENEEYSSREFLRAVTYSFYVSNDKYFDEWAAQF